MGFRFHVTLLELILMDQIQRRILATLETLREKVSVFVSIDFSFVLARCHGDARLAKV